VQLIVLVCHRVTARVLLEIEEQMKYGNTLSAHVDAFIA
jgi:hypothetical protein